MLVPRYPWVENRPRAASRIAAWRSPRAVSIVTAIQRPSRDQSLACANAVASSPASRVAAPVASSIVYTAPCRRPTSVRFASSVRPSCENATARHAIVGDASCVSRRGVRVARSRTPTSVIASVATRAE